MELNATSPAYDDYTRSEATGGDFLKYAELPGSIQARRLWLYGSPVLIIVGTIGNVLAGLVTTRKSLRASTTSLYLTVLAVVDTAILYTGLLRHWIRILTGVDVRTLSVAGCKVHFFGIYYFIQFEAWILAWVAVERIVAIFVPLKAKTWFTRTFSAIQLAVTGVVLAALNAPLLVIFTIVGGTHCDIPNKAHKKYFSGVWGWLDFCLSSLIPFTIMLTASIAIVIRLIYVSSMRKKKMNVKNDVKMTSMTAILFTVSFLFFLTTAPITVYLSTVDYWYTRAKTPEDEAKLDLVWAGMNILMYLNNTLNFFLYSVSGARFRKELLCMLHLDRNRVHPLNSGNSMTFTHDTTA